MASLQQPWCCYATPVTLFVCLVENVWLDIGRGVIYPLQLISDIESNGHVSPTVDSEIMGD